MTAPPTDEPSPRAPSSSGRAPPTGMPRRSWRGAGAFLAWTGLAVCGLWALPDYLRTDEVVTLFKITAETERIELVVAATGTDPIHLSGAGVADGPRDPVPITGELRLADGARVVLTRFPEDSAIALVAEAPSGGGSVGTLHPDGGPPVALDASIAVALPLGAGGGAGRPSLHFAAHDARIGAVWRPGRYGFPQPMLRAGRVSLIGLAEDNVPFESQSFELGPYEMLTGFPRGRAADEASLWWGVVTAEAGSAMTATFAVMDTRIALWRGSERYPLGVTAFDHLRGHPRFALLCAAFVLFVQIVAALLTHTLQTGLDRRASTSTLLKRP